MKTLLNYINESNNELDGLKNEIKTTAEKWLKQFQNKGYVTVEHDKDNDGFKFTLYSGVKSNFGPGLISYFSIFKKGNKYVFLPDKRSHLNSHEFELKNWQDEIWDFIKYECQK